MTCFPQGGPNLATRFRAGERDALESVYREYVGLVAKTVTAVLRRFGEENGRVGWQSVASEVPDLVQEVFIRAFDPRCRRSLDETRPYGPYLGQIARNTVVDHLRRRRLSYRMGNADSGAQGEHESMGSGGDDDFADPQTVTLVNRYIAALPPDMRRVHEALYVRGLSQRTAAASLGMGRQVLRTLERRLRDGLRELLRESEGASPTAPPSVRPEQSIEAVGQGRWSR